MSPIRSSPLFTSSQVYSDIDHTFPFTLFNLWEHNKTLTENQPLSVYLRLKGTYFLLGLRFNDGISYWKYEVDPTLPSQIERMVLITQACSEGMENGSILLQNWDNSDGNGRHNRVT